MLIADIGGTRARFALSGGPGEYGEILELPTGAASFPATVAEARAKLAPNQPVEMAAFAVAGAVRDGKARLTNAGWAFDAAALPDTLGIAGVAVINDFAAIGQALPYLGGGDLEHWGGGGGDDDAPKLVVGPGTGFGVCAAVPVVGGGWRVVPGEGGHVTLAARTKAEDRVLAALRQRFDHVSAERAVSGAGLETLYEVLSGAPLKAEAIAAAAQAGDADALQAVRVFTDFFATVAADAALTFGAAGGVYLVGGVLSGLGRAFDVQRFRARFTDKGRFSGYLDDVPLYRVRHPAPGLFGLTYLR